MDIHVAIDARRGRRIDMLFESVHVFLHLAGLLIDDHYAQYFRVPRFFACQTGTAASPVFSDGW